jgi:hypothetical protein
MEPITLAQALKKFPEFCGTRKFITQINTPLYPQPRPK